MTEENQNSMMSEEEMKELAIEQILETKESIVQGAESMEFQCFVNILQHFIMVVPPQVQGGNPTVQVGMSQAKEIYKGAYKAFEEVKEEIALEQEKQLDD